MIQYHDYKRAIEWDTPYHIQSERKQPCTTVANRVLPVIIVFYP